MGREAGTAQAHQPGSTDCRGKALKVSNLRNLDRFIDLLQFVGGDLHGLDGIAVCADDLVDLGDLTGNTGMDRRADKGVSIADDLTYFDQVGQLHGGSTLPAHVLLHRDHYLVGHRHLDGFHLSSILAVRDLDAIQRF